MSTVRQPTITNHYRECRRSKRNAKKENAGLEIPVDSTLQLADETPETPGVDAPLVYESNIVLPNKTRRTTRKAKTTSRDGNQSVLKFGDKEHSKNEKSEQLVESVSSLPEKQELELPKDSKSNENYEHEIVKDSEPAKLGVSGKDKLHASAYKPKSRSAQILANLNLPKYRDEQIIRPELSIVTTVHPTESVSLNRNVDVQIIRSPIKRKPNSESDPALIETPSSPRKMVKKIAIDQDKSPELQLPVKYKLLLDKFIAVETSVQMMFNRKEQCEFDKIVSAVEQMTARKFQLSDLAKIVTVYPEAYSMTWEKKYKCMVTKSFYWTLCLKPQITSNKEHMMASEVVARKAEFANSLYGFVHDEHASFIKKMNPNVEVDKSKIKRWHPKFNLESVPDIKESDLPEKPASMQPRQGLNELIMKTKEKATEKMENALAKLEAMNNPLSPKTPKTASPKSDKRQFKFPNSSSGLSEKLRLKIQAKEAVRTQEDLTMPREEREKRALEAKLVEVAKIIRVLFLADKRTAILDSEVVAKCKSGVSGGLSPEHVKICIDNMEKRCPDWISSVEVQGKVYLKVSKNVDFNKVVSKLQIIA